MAFWKKIFKSKYTGREIDAAVAKAGNLPATTSADAGKALVVDEEGKIVAGEAGGGGMVIYTYDPTSFNIPMYDTSGTQTGTDTYTPFTTELHVPSVNYSFPVLFVSEEDFNLLKQLKLGYLEEDDPPFQISVAPIYKIGILNEVCYSLSSPGDFPSSGTFIISDTNKDIVLVKIDGDTTAFLPESYKSILGEANK